MNDSLVFSVEPKQPVQPEALSLENQYIAAGPLTLLKIIELARQNYPAIRKAQAQLAAAQAGIGIAKSAYLPSLNLFVQNNLATYNKLPGLFFPEAGILPVAGASPNNQLNHLVSGEYSGALLSWNAYDFGYRRAQINQAKGGVNVAAANKALTELDVISQAIQAYLGVQTAQRVVEASQANLKRMTVFEQVVAVLVKSGLRPGVDESRAMADVALARTQLINAQQQFEVGKAILAQAIGQAGEPIIVSAETFLDILPNITPQQSSSIDAHPLLMLEQQKIGVIQAQEKVLQKSYFPKLYLQGGLNGRGSQLDAQEKDLGLGHGLYPSRLNYGVEANLIFNPFDIVTERIQMKQVRFQEATEKAQYDETMQQLLGALSQAKAQVEASVQVAQNTPVEVSAAKMTEIQSSARYKAGLATLLDVADAQRLLVNAQIDDALAKLDVWKSLLEAAKAQGHLEPFIQLTQYTQSSMPSAKPGSKP